MRDGSGKWLPSRWHELMGSCLEAIDSVSSHGEVIWTFGGGTALAIDLGHRISYDVDIFLDSAAVTKRLVPVTNEVTRRICWNPKTGRADYQWPGSYLKLIVFGKGEIDFLNATTLVETPTAPFEFAGRVLMRERPREIIAKKIYYRGSVFKGRDVFDLACTYHIMPEELRIAARSSYLSPDILKRVEFRINSQKEALTEAIAEDTNPTEIGIPLIETACETALAAIGMMEREAGLNTA
ncbi:nucleotidyl transferase AbiEii/AbiGii toxin family protein [Rhizobium sp. LjRoot254]|uniref:nucleotidyl transferase AbiEii/AbiGii toxin family protein n=1 Tax=Rhizobium sp. LjRoot254 TaxID=3342297 RepID=UPI003ED02FE9